MPSHAQVRFSLCSLLLLLFCFCFYCSCCYYYYYYGYLLAKGFYYIWMHSYFRRTNLDILYSSSYEYKPGHFNKQNFSLVLCFLPLFALPFSLSPLMTIIWVDGYLTHMISPALLLAFALCSPLLSLSSDDHYMGWRLSNPYDITSFAPCFCSSLSLSLSLLWWPLYGLTVSNPYDITSFAPRFCSLLSLSLSLLWWPLYGLTVSNPYDITSFAPHFCSLLSPSLFLLWWPLYGLTVI